MDIWGLKERIPERREQQEVSLARGVSQGGKVGKEVRDYGVGSYETEE